MTDGTQTDWELAEAFLREHPTRWGSLQWIAARPLIASINQVISANAGHIVGELRSHYVDRSPNPSLIVYRPDITSFMVIGDTGESDGSQYVVAPELSRAVRAAGSGFVTINSDVIYPAGDVNEYVDGVYRPYRSLDNDQFSVYAPMFGQPGNHDWYGSNYGLMYHFCGQERPDSAWYAPTSINPIHRLARILWRRPSPVRKAARLAREQTPLLYGGMTQPGPYFAVRIRDALVVHIDTGIDGTIDPRQMQWLVGLSQLDPGPKILVTGSPLVVNARIEKCAVVPHDPSLPASVWDLVNDPANRYVATMGGDIHNFQRYTVPTPVPGTPQVHIVCGGGGAFMAAIHPIDFAVNDSRTDLSEPHPYPDLLFPTTHESFAFFGKQLVPSIWRMFRTLLLFVLGGLTSSAAALFGDLLGLERPALLRTLALGSGAALTVLAVIRMFMRRVARTNWSKRLIVGLVAYTLGVGAAGLAGQLDPEHFQSYLVLWGLTTLWHVVFGWGISRTGWWLPEADHPQEREVGPLGFYLGLGGLVAISVGVQIAFFPTLPHILLAGVAGLLLFVLGLIGRFVRKRTTAAAWWRAHSAQLAILSQVAYFGSVVAQLAIAQDLLGRFFGGILGIPLLLLMALVTGALLLGVTELFVLPVRPFPGSSRRWWSAVANVVHNFPLIFMAGLIVLWSMFADGPLQSRAVAVLLVLSGLVVVLGILSSFRKALGVAYGWIALALFVGAVVLAIWWEGSPRLAGTGLALAALGLPIVLTAVVASLYLVDLIRRWLPTAYKPIILITFAGAAVAAYVWANDTIRVAAAAAIILMAVGTSMLLAHLVFLGVLGILFDADAHAGRVEFSENDLYIIFTALTMQPRPQVPQVSPKVRRWAKLTYHGVGEPGGPLQANVAEVYSLDEPPFFKQFLQLDTTGSQLIITNHLIYGDRPAQIQVVATVNL